MNGICGTDKSLTRGGDSDRAAHSAFVDKVAQLWEKGAEFLIDGRYMDDVGLSVSSPAVLAKGYRSGSGYAAAMWNTSASSVKARVAVEPARIGVNGRMQAASSLAGTSIRQNGGPDGGIELELQPHAVDLIVFRRAPSR